VRLADVSIRLLAGLIVVLLAVDWTGRLDQIDEIPISLIQPLQHHGYELVLPDRGVAGWFYSDGDSDESSGASPLRVFEDGRAIGKPHSDHQEINELGGGLYSHWGGALRFSTSDNSDPRSNGHRYSFDLPPDAWRLVLVPGLLLLALIGWRQLAGLADGLPEIRLAVAGLSGSYIMRFAIRRRRVFCYAASITVAAYFVGCYAFGAPPIPLIAPDSSSYWLGVSIVPLGYPAFLWTIYRIFGVLHAVIIAQATLFAAAVIAVQTGTERVTGSPVAASMTAITLLTLGATPSAAIWLLSESVFASLLLFHVAAAGWVFAKPTRQNLVAIAFTSILAISVRPAGYFLIGGVLFLLLFWTGQRRMVFQWALCPLIALLIILYGLDLSIPGRANSGNGGANLFPHVARLYDRPPPDLPPEIAAETQGPILKSYQLAQRQTPDWQRRQVLEQLNFNLILREISNRIPQNPTGQKLLLDMALYTIEEHPIGYLQTVLDNLTAWYAEYLLINVPDTADVLAHEYDQFWQTGQEFILHYGIPPINVTLGEVKSDYLLTRSTASIEAFKVPPRLLPWTRAIYLISGILATAAFLLGYGGPRASFLAYVAVLAFGGALLVSVSTVFIKRYAIPLDPLILIVVLLGLWNAMAAIRPAIQWMKQRVADAQSRAGGCAT